MKKKIAIVILILVLVGVICGGVYFLKHKNKNENNVQGNTSENFEVSKIQYYCDISATSNQTTYQNPEWDLNVYEYADIAIYLERTEDYETSNYIKKLSLNNIQISETKIGEQKLYYLNPLDFGNGEISEFSEEDEILDSLEYNIMNYENEDNDVKYSIPIFFEDCSNPITLRYLNLNLLEDYKFSNSDKLQFNGSLLKTAGTNLDDLKATITLDLNILTQDNQTQIINLQIDIPLSEEIYDGAIFKIE